MESNQTSSPVNENNQTNLNTSNQSKSSYEILNLGSNLRTDMVNNMTKFANLLNGQTIVKNDKKELHYANIQVIQRLSTLTSDNGNWLNDLRSIDENLIKDSNENNGGLYFELNFSTRRDIIDLLIRNFSALFLSKCTISEKKNLARENNAMICILSNLVPKTFDTSDDVIEGTIESRPSSSHLTINSYERIACLIRKVEKLEEKFEKIDNPKKELIKDIYVNKDEAEFYFSVKNIEEFLKTRQSVRSEYFYCSSIKWFLGIQSNREENGVKYLSLYIWSNESFADNLYKWSVRANYDLVLVHPFNSHLNMSKSTNHLFTNREGQGFPYFIRQDVLAGYIENDTIKVGVKLKAEIINEFQNLKKV